ncbi:MAG TPA: helix-turn-helix domain-containing protein [Mycobacteriales bacterium]|nr:helix-turn-helix domain-containing protein [Mycobacteriales bacterium]
MATTWQRVRRASSRLSTEAVRGMEGLPWFASLPAAQRADVGMVVQAGIGAFTDWFRDTSAPPTAQPDIFRAAPRDLARAVSLKQTVQLIRVVVGVLEDEVPQLAEPGHEQELLEAVLRYSREVAFAAAEVYAAAAEARGAWDARLEAHVVEAIARDQVGELSLSRATSLGWGQPSWVLALVAVHPGGPVEERLEDLRGHARHSGLMVLTGEAGGALVVVVGGKGKPEVATRQVAAALPPGPVVVGPRVADLTAAGSAVREALAGLSAVAAWPHAPRPVLSSDLLAERAVMGDETARRRLVEDVHTPLSDAGGDLLETVAAFLEAGGSVEGAARALYVHANTVRYRLRKVSELIGLDVLRPRDAQVATTALVLGRTQTL